MKILAHHITWGTYGTRLHGDSRGTVDRNDNQYQSPILGYDKLRWEKEKARLKFPPVIFSIQQRIRVESLVPAICKRGLWTYHACAAGPDHIHVVLSAIHPPQTIRRLMKRWLGEELSTTNPLPENATWWAECGSIRSLDSLRYFNSAMNYVSRQRATKTSQISPIPAISN
jgi:REP element-mobilizing transposase RayT